MKSGLNIIGFIIILMLGYYYLDKFNVFDYANDSNKKPHSHDGGEEHIDPPQNQCRTARLAINKACKEKTGHLSRQETMSDSERALHKDFRTCMRENREANMPASCVGRGSWKKEECKAASKKHRESCQEKTGFASKPLTTEQRATQKDFFKCRKEGMVNSYPAECKQQ